MQWNDLTWEEQKQILDKIEDLLLQQTDEKVQDAMVAAISELEIWSNRECKILQEFEGFLDDEYIAEASDQT